MANKEINVVLYKVEQNLNFAYRTAEFFGVKKIYLYSCNATLQGNLFMAKDNIELEVIHRMPKGKNVMYFETNGKLSLNDVDFSEVDTICIGCESQDFRGSEFKDIEKVKIKGYGKVSGLTVATSLAIILNKIRNG